MKKEMLINVLQPEECRIAIVEDGILEELYVERTGQESYVGNIYKGRIVNIEPGIQAAFVDFGVGRNGFLHVSDVEPTYYRHIEGFSDVEASEDDWGGGSRSESRQQEPRTEGGEGRSFRPRTEGGRGDGGRRDGPRRGGERRGGRGPSQDNERRRQIVDELKKDLLESGFGVENEGETVAPPQEETRDGEAPSGKEQRGRRRRRGQGPGRGGRQVGDRQEPTAQVESTAQGEPTSNAFKTEGDSDSGNNSANEGSAINPSQDNTPPSMESQSRFSLPGDEPEISPPSMGAGSDEDELLFTPRKPISTPQQTIVPVETSGPIISSSSAAVTPKVVEILEEDAIIFRSRPSSQREQQGALPGFEAEIVETHSQVIVSRPIVEQSDLDVIGENLGFGRDSEVSAEETQSQEESPQQTDVQDGSESGERPQPRRDRNDRGDRRGPPMRGGPRDGGDRGRGGPRMRGRDAGRTGSGRPKPSIQEIFKRGQEVIVQVIKEGIGSKGPTLSTYVSIAGRFLVLMPGLNRVGISRKILDEGARRRLRDVFNQLRPPKGLGFIIRTAGVDKTKTELQRDLVYLSRLWQVVARRIKKTKSPAEVYQESDMITRTIRDTFTTDIDTIWVDEKRACEHAQEFLQFVMPQHADRIKHFEDPEPLFHRYGLEEEIAKINLKKVPLPHGGSIVIEQTEALVAIDVNSGNFRTDSNNAEETAFQMNMAAAKEIARQLRLRDLGGVIVNDFIDMREEKHRRTVERALRDAMSRDRARTKVLRISGFGIIEMTRQRIRPSLRRSVFHDCPFCNGISYVKTSESMSLDVIRLIQLASCRNYISSVRLRVSDGVANFLLNKKRRVISELEAAGNMEVEIFGAHGVAPEMLEIQCFDPHGNEVRINPYAEIPPARIRR